MRALRTLLLVSLMASAAVSVVIGADTPKRNSAEQPADVDQEQKTARSRVSAIVRELQEARRNNPPRQPVFPPGQFPFVGDSRGGRAASSPVLGSWIVQLAMPSAAAALAPPSGDRAAVAAAIADPNTDGRGRNIEAARVHAQAVYAHITAVAAAAGVDNKISQRYTHAMSGFVVRNITFAELQALRSDPAVVAVTPSQLAHKQTFSSPWFLGLTSKQGESPNPLQSRHQPQGLWDKVSPLLHGLAYVQPCRSVVN